MDSLAPFRVLGAGRDAAGVWLWWLTCLALLLVAGMGAGPAALAQGPQLLPDTLFVVGTSTTDSQGRAWGYVLWIASDQELALGRTFAVYGKPGDPATPGNYTRRAVTGLQTEPPVIQALLNRARNLGDSLPDLEERVDSLFAALQPPAGPLANKLSAVIRGSLADPAQFNNLVLLGRLHPGLNFCLGYAHAEPLDGGKTTFEIREFDKAGDRDLGVVGRVTVEAGNPSPLPQAGPLVQVPEASAKGDLNVKLRWATSPDLRRATLLNHGFHVYRVTRAFAEAQGFHTTAPQGPLLRQLSTNNPAVRRVNDLPVLKNKDFDAAQVGNLALDPTTAFVADDNGRYKAGGVALRNGDQYYYFVTALDVLGRDWRASPGVLVTICDRVPPDAPRGVQVFNDYSFSGGVTRQVLRVRWIQSTNTADRVVRYFVYRWSSPDEVQKLAGLPLSNRVSGPIAHLPGQEFGSFIDDGPTSPKAPADYGRTWWYTVRAVDDGACDGGNLSPNSAPAFGVLRDRTGPGAPDGTINVLCCVPEVKGGSPEDRPVEKPADQSLAAYRFLVKRSRPEIEWAEFYIHQSLVASNYIGRVWFPGDASEVLLEWTTPVSGVAEGFINFHARVGTDAGELSGFATVATTRAPKFGTVRVVPYEARLDCRRLPRREAAAGTAAGAAGAANRKYPGCNGSHDPRPEGDGGPVVGPGLVIQLTPGTKEYRLYRRVDNGPMTLIKQAPADFNDASQVVIDDPDMPANAATICYYGQLYDEHGNPSPLVLLDECIEIHQPMAVPMLLPIEPFGDTSSPKMRIRWFCPPYGVDRFEVSIASSLGFLAATVSPDLGENTTNRVKQVTVNGTVQTNQFFLYRTHRVGPAFGNGAQFEIFVDAALGVTFTAVVAAVGPDGAAGKDSNAEEFRWSAPPAAVGPDVPWPARPLPDVNVFHAGLRAFRLPDAYYPGNAIRIGVFARTFLVSEKPTQEKASVLRSNVDPMSLLYTNRHRQGLFPAAVYRVQVASPEFPEVSRDIVQVTPLMESIAREFAVLNGIPVTWIHDPYILASPNVESNNTVGDEGAIYLLDTQPVIAGARYLYLVVRFGSNGEILEVVPTNAVEVTP